MKLVFYIKIHLGRKISALTLVVSVVLSGHGLCNLLISYSYSLCPDLMAVALEKKDMHLLQICLERFPDIPEEITYACLKAFLR